MKDITIHLAEFISQLTYDQISEKAVATIKSCVLDALGCAFGGSVSPWGRIVNEFVQGQGGIQEASLWTTDFMGPAANVVLGNGTMIHSFDFDDYHMTKIHPGAVVIPAAVAVGEKGHIHGKRLITAAAAGYETMIHISRGLNPGVSRLKGWHLTGTCGTFAAAAAVGSVLGFDARTMASALGMAGTQSSGLWAFTADGSHSKRFHPGRAAQSGLIAGSLAGAGYLGPTRILEAEDGGFFNATSSEFDYDKVLEGLGNHFDSEDVAIKPYPACGSLHSSIDAAMRIGREHEIDVEKIKEIRVYNSDVVDVQCGFDYRPMGVLQAQMSMKYCVARTLIDGALSMNQFTEEKLSEPLAVDLASRVRFVFDEEIDKIYRKARGFPSIVEVVAGDGATYGRRVDMPKGSVANPMSWDEVVGKFHSMADGVVGRSQAEAIVRHVQGLEDLEDVCEITRLMRAPS